MATESKNDKPRQCRLLCVDKEGKPRYLAPGRQFDICPVCAGNIGRLSTKTSAEVENFVHTLEVRLNRGQMVVQGGKGRDGKLDPKTYLGQLKLKRKRMKTVYV